MISVPIVIDGVVAAIVLAKRKKGGADLGISPRQARRQQGGGSSRSDSWKRILVGGCGGPGLRCGWLISRFTTCC